MRVSKAFQAFFKSLFKQSCKHHRVKLEEWPGYSQNPMDNHRKMSQYCEDCGYRVVFVWAFCRCRSCGSKRQSISNSFGEIVPKTNYCKHCGKNDYQVVKKYRINSVEASYAILDKEIDYIEQQIETSHVNFNRSYQPIGKGFYKLNRLSYTDDTASPVVEGELLRKVFV